tara:strand:- start:118670 stop:119596 length:927 start_codon:yes stop_codon:yes gene_type:complete
MIPIMKNILVIIILFCFLDCSPNKVDEVGGVENSKGQVVIVNTIEVLNIGRSFHLEIVYLNSQEIIKVPKEIKWFTSNPEIVSINSEGKLTAHKTGIVTITVQTENVTDIIEINSVYPEKVIDFSSYRHYLYIGDIYKFNAVVYDEFGVVDASGIVNWESSNPSILQIDNEGNSNSLFQGNGEIIAFSDNLEKRILVEIREKKNQNRLINITGLKDYNNSGSGILKMVKGELILELNNLKLQGPLTYFYLTNHFNKITDGLRLRLAEDGSYSINISEIDPQATLYSYDYVGIWCELFNDMVGFGELSY